MNGIAFKRLFELSMGAIDLMGANTEKKVFPNVVEMFGKLSEKRGPNQDIILRIILKHVNLSELNNELINKAENLPRDLGMSL